jgi:hypothetical protein
MVVNPDEILRQLSEMFEASRAKPRIVRIFAGILRLLDRGEDHMRVWKSVRDIVHKDTSLVELATSFFMLTGVAHVEAAALNAAKLTDRHPDSANVTYLLNTIEADRTELVLREDWPRAKIVIVTARQRLLDIAEVIARIKQRRDQEIAHLDRREMDISPDWQGVEVADLHRVFDTIEAIVQDLAAAISAFALIKRFSLHTYDPSGFDEFIHFARAGFDDELVESPSERAEAIRQFDRLLREREPK